MDWFLMLIFVVFMILDAAGKSKKQKEKREARQQQDRPVPKRTISVPSPKSPPPVAMPDWDFSPFFPFLEEKEEEEIAIPNEPVVVVKKEPPLREELVERPRRSEHFKDTRNPVRQGEKMAEIYTSRDWDGFGLEQAQMGIIWSEILSRPRALRPYRSRGYRG